MVVSLARISLTAKILNQKDLNPEAHRHWRLPGPPPDHPGLPKAQTEDCDMKGIGRSPWRPCEMDLGPDQLGQQRSRPRTGLTKGIVHFRDAQWGWKGILYTRRLVQQRPQGPLYTPESVPREFQQPSSTIQQYLTTHWGHFTRLSLPLGMPTDQQYCPTVPQQNISWTSKEPQTGWATKGIGGGWRYLPASAEE